MPGFSIPGAGAEDSDRPNNTQEVHRAHRFRLAEIGDIDLIQYNLIYIRDIDLPAASFESEEVEGTAIKYKFAKMATFDDLTLTFYDVEKIIDPIIEKLDHAFMVNNDDKHVISFLEKMDSKKIIVDFNSTAENISKYLLVEIIFQVPFPPETQAPGCRLIMILPLPGNCEDD